MSRVLKVYNVRGDVESRIKEGKNIMSWDKASSHRFSVNEAGLKIDILTYNLLHLMHHYYLWKEETRRFTE